MKIIKEVVSEDCFDGNFIKEYIVDTTITDEWIIYLEQFGTMTFLKNLENPFYSFDKQFFFTIKGILNENKIKVIFRRNTMDKSKEFFNLLLHSYKGSIEDQKKVKYLEKEILKEISKHLR